jgi:hypothetical protein
MASSFSSLRRWYVRLWFWTLSGVPRYPGFVLHSSHSTQTPSLTATALTE